MHYRVKTITLRESSILRVQSFTSQSHHSTTEYSEYYNNGHIKMVTSIMVMLLLPTDVHNLDMIDSRSERCDGKSGICIALALPPSSPRIYSYLQIL